MPQLTEDIQYLRTLPTSELVARADTNPTPALAIALAQRLRDNTASGQRIAPNHPAFLGV